MNNPLILLPFAGVIVIILVVVMLVQKKKQQRVADYYIEKGAISAADARYKGSMWLDLKLSDGKLGAIAEQLSLIDSKGKDNRIIQIYLGKDMVILSSNIEMNHFSPVAIQKSDIAEIIFQKAPLGGQIMFTLILTSGDAVTIWVKPADKNTVLDTLIQWLKSVPIENHFDANTNPADGNK